MKKLYIITALLGLAVIGLYVVLDRRIARNEEAQKVVTQKVEDWRPTEVQKTLVDGAMREMKQNLGATQPVGLFTYRLSGSGLSSSATSFTLTSLTLPQNDYPIQDSDVSSTFHLTIEPGSTDRQEFVSCTTIGTNTGSSVTISGCTRGISPVPDYSASTTLRFSHPGGSAVIFSNSPSLYNEYIATGNNATSTGVHAWSSTTPPRYDQTPPNHKSGAIVATTSEFASMAALSAVVASGCLDASTSNQGCVEIGTPTEVSSSTANGSEAQLVIPASMATSTPTACTSILRCVVVSIGNKISQTWLDLTENFSWTGQHTFNATTTQAGYVKQASTYGSWGGGYLPTGTMLTYASSTPPDGFLACNGAAVSRTTYTMLFSVIGTTYGVGDGSTTFNVPDARGRNTLFASSTTNMAQSAGESNHTMTTAELVAHTHTVVQDVSPNDGGYSEINSGDATPDTTGNTGSTGSSAPFNVLDPYLVSFCIIKI